ncbi:hypothetical protein [Candidatus Venteria ishoeyi]|uniref:Yip1 domain protein n=1 Tax=Candidatus Venteria ishoeyi TaxID=1899563 RepID=A0A1H6FG36_9GAMM|nr:hypothetical protein [Candidatus Venteria ishoeyi]SEH09022.1 Uncharacterised protein [Candidatus Venteria ishoeyi]
MSTDKVFDEETASTQDKTLDFSLDEENNAHLPTQARFMQLIDALLKSHRSLYRHIYGDSLRSNAFKLLLLALFSLLVYGLIMGAFSGGIQWFAAPLKVALGTTLAALLCYPSLYILVALSGADLRPGQAAALLISSLALMTILLVGFAPVAFVFTFSIQALPFMGMVHLLIWLVSLYFGLRYFIQGVITLGGKDLMMLKVWVFIFLLTLMQMSTTLRPILGTGERWFTPEKQFFILHWLQNMHVI